MGKKVTVSANQVTKRFDLAEKQSDKLKAVFKFWGKPVPDFWAVKGVTFEATAGETIGVIGTNGSGKSTLLEMVAGVREPTSGSLEVNGKTSIIAVGAGMRPQLTGRANIRLKCLLQGMSEEQIDQKMDDIIAFSELGEFIDQPVKSYSSGMKSKLGFAISTYSDSDIVIIDEALSVGDPTFTEKSIERTKRFKAEGKTIFFVAHSISQMKQVADRVLWMHHGDLLMDGPIEEVMPEYEKFIKRFNKFSETERAAYYRRYKDAQKDFSLSKLEKLTSNKRLIDDSHTNTANRRLKRTFQEEDTRMPISSQIILAITTVFLSILIGMQLMNISWSSFNELSDMSSKNSSGEMSTRTLVQNKFTVKEPMTLSQLSNRTNISVDKLRQYNQLENDNLQPGQIIRLSSEE